jgi:DNA repair photolyase
MSNDPVIYVPKGPAFEYAPLATNPYRGCGHKCVYCYVPGQARMTRAQFDAGATDRTAYLPRLLKNLAKLQCQGCREQVMLSFLTDPYHPFDTTLTRQALQALRDHGLGFCTLSKGGLKALRDLDLFRVDGDAYATTLTSLSDGFAAKWERGAAPPTDRIATLRAFFEAGIFTWVSLEPVLSAEHTLAVVEATHGFVNLYKCGKLNHLKLANAPDWRDYTDRLLALLNRLGKAHYVKADLQFFLPDGYVNEMRRPQHH